MGLWPCLLRDRRAPDGAAQQLAASGLALLFFVVPLLATVWVLAAKDGQIPTGAWGVHDGNHGPWRHVYHLRAILDFTLWLPVQALIQALGAALWRSSIEAWFVVVASLTMWFFLLGSHYWLID